MLSRKHYMDKLFDSRRSIDDECGYPNVYSLSANDYRQMYDVESIAARVVEVLPKETWKKQPSVFEDEDADTVTEFEEAWLDLAKTLRGEKSWYQDEEGHPVWEYLLRADILSGIGSFGVLLLGVDDGKDLREPLEPKKGLKLLYLRAFDESLIQITRYEQNHNNPRFGRPTEYMLTFNDPNESAQGGIGLPLASQTVHWSRCIHIADNLGSSEIFGIPRQRPVFRRLLNLEKLYGGSAEMYWRAAFPGLSIETHPQLQGDVDLDTDSIKDDMEQYMNTLQRYLLLTGMSAKSLAPQVTDPGPQIDSQITAICILTGIPMRIFMGSERGELASGQDDSTWNDRLASRQVFYVTPRVIVPFVDRLVEVGILPEPEGYSVVWPDLGALTETEQATMGVSKTEAMAKYVGGGVEALMEPMNYLTRIMMFTQEEATEILKATNKAMEEKEAEAEEKAEEERQRLIDEGQPPPGQPGQPPPQQPGQQQPQQKPGGGKAPGPFPVAQASAENAFCATGKGGGVDPTCSSKEARTRTGKAGESLDRVEASVGNWLDKNNASGRPLEPSEAGELAKHIGTNTDKSDMENVKFSCMSGKCPTQDERNTMILYEDDNVSAYVLRWGEGQEAEWHDHGEGRNGARVGIYGLQGSPENDFLGPKGQIVRQRIPEGATLALGAPYIHRVAGDDKIGAWTVHVYSGNEGGLGKMNFYKFDPKSKDLTLDRNGKPIKTGEWINPRFANKFTATNKLRFNQDDQSPDFIWIEDKNGKLVPRTVEELIKKGVLKPVRKAEKDKDETANNVFCPTGKGGGRDPTCSPGKRGGGFPKANPQGRNTFDQFRNSDGSWTSERSELHESIIGEVMEGKSPVENPVAIMMGGGPASGKSSVIKTGEVKISENSVKVDSDEVKTKLPEYQTMVKSGDSSAASFVHEESSYVGKQIQARASSGGYNTVLDGTGDSDIDSLKKKTDGMRSSGQKVVAHYVTVDTDEAVRRSMQRAEKTGRMVPEAFIRANHANVSRVVPEAINQGLFDEFSLWDTNGGGAKKIAEASGRSLNILDQAAWDKFVAKGS